MNESVEVREPKKQQLIDEFANARQQVFKSIEALDTIEMEKSVMDGWSIKDILVHIIEWDRRSIKDAKDLLQNREVDQAHWINPDEFNSKAVEKYRATLVPQVIDDLARVTQEAVEFLSATPEEELFRKRHFEYKGEKISVAWILSYPEHDVEHANQILAWRDQQDL